MRWGIGAAGNWTVDRVKVIDAWPAEERLAHVLSVQRAGGGGAHNVLVDLALMKAPFPLLGIGSVGDDEDGRYLIEEAKELGIDFSGIRVSLEAPTSFTDVMSVKSTGRRTFFHARGANALLEDGDIDPENCKILHLAHLLILDRIDPVASKVLQRVRRMGVKTSLDLVSEEDAPFHDVAVPALDFVDYLIVNEFEAGKCAGIEIRRPDGTWDETALVAAARILYRQNLVVIHMPEGAFALSREGQVYMPSTPVRDIAGAVGAGDAFCAGVLYGLHEGWSVEQSLDLGHRAAAACLAHPTPTGGLRPVPELLTELKPGDRSSRPG